jgi:hypothetical protein
MWKQSWAPPPRTPWHSAAAMEAFFQLNGCTSTGGWPRDAQVRRTLGVRLSALSSKKTRQALRRAAFLLDSRPVLGDPAVDRGLVALGGAAGRALHSPAEPVTQQRPHMGRVVTHPGQPLDHGGDAVQGPQLADEPVSRSPFQQGLPDLAELGVGHLGRRAAGSSAMEGVGAARLEAGVPDADGLGGDAKLAGDFGLVDADGEQLSGAQPAGLASFTFLLCRGAAGDGWHGPSCPAGPVQLHPASTQHPRTG